MNLFKNRSYIQSAQIFSSGCRASMRIRAPAGIPKGSVRHEVRTALTLLAFCGGMNVARLTATRRLASIFAACRR